MNSVTLIDPASGRPKMFWMLLMILKLHAAAYAGIICKCKARERIDKPTVEVLVAGRAVTTTKKSASATPVVNSVSERVLSRQSVPS